MNNIIIQCSGRRHSLYQSEQIDKVIECEEWIQKMSERRQTKKAR